MAMECVCHMTQQREHPGMHHEQPPMHPGMYHEQQKMHPGMHHGQPPMHSGMHQEHQTKQYGMCQDQKQQRMPTLKDIDLCKSVKRTEEEQHNSYECHMKGEKMQNLIHKVRMFLDEYDDRPVMKRKGDKEEGKALGQSGFGPMIKYPGYVDYDHPYFSSPYDKMPTLAMTVGQRSLNTCPPDKVRNFDECFSNGQQLTAAAAAAAHQGEEGEDSVVESSDGKCRCAARSGEPARCRVATTSPGSGAGPGHHFLPGAAHNTHPYQNTYGTHAGSGPNYASPPFDPAQDCSC